MLFGRNNNYETWVVAYVKNLSIIGHGRRFLENVIGLLSSKVFFEMEFVTESEFCRHYCGILQEKQTLNFDQ